MIKHLIKAFNIDQDPKHDGYQRRLASKLKLKKLNKKITSK